MKQRNNINCLVKEKKCLSISSKYVKSRGAAITIFFKAKVMLCNCSVWFKIDESEI